MQKEQDNVLVILALVFTRWLCGLIQAAGGTARKRIERKVFEGNQSKHTEASN